ncbi:hypothetical protein FDW83_17050 [Pseudarthrobacter sp. NamE2]|uniref:hypothetical protein n=1 Tax=Pseudarthrobacter sp. NamE2 TaxID=2576838 RepID=UPI0010FD6D73|nr:hypothetical protein [Pseudarthrobacter sp. NamE2]TLM81204.1 hypothetical protein FDW83_17050 [Pseudarthrobacter sp. NamE2]
MCRDVPVYTGYQAPEFDFWVEAGKVISGMFIDMVEAAAAGLILILFALMFMGEEAPAKKRKKIFW